MLTVPASATIATSSAGASSIIFWSCVLIGLLVFGFVVLTRVKRTLGDETDETPSAGAGFTLSDLRQLHRTGQMSDEEFERAKEKIVGAARRSAGRGGLAKSPDDNPQSPS